MESLQATVDNFQDRRREVLEQLDADEQDVQIRLQAAQTTIAAGEDTTRNKLHDGLIVMYGKDLLESPQILERYERVTKELRGKTGEPVIAISRQQTMEGCTGFGGKGEKVTRKLYSVGRLSGTKLVFDYDERSASLPTTEYAESEGMFGYGRDRAIQTTEGALPVTTPRFSLSPYRDLGRQLDVSVKLSDPFERDRSSTALTLAIGYAGIENWLANDYFPQARELLVVRKLSEAIGLPPIEPVTERQKAYVEDDAAAARG